MNFVDTNERAFPSGTNVIPRFARVTLNSSGILIAAPATNACIGTIRDDTFGVAGEVHSVRLASKGGTIPMIAASTNITAGGYVYGAASGKVDSTGTIAEGISLVAPASANDIIEVIPRQ